MQIMKVIFVCIFIVWRKCLIAILSLHAEFSVQSFAWGTAMNIMHWGVMTSNGDKDLVLR